MKYINIIALSVTLLSSDAVNAEPQTDSHCISCPDSLEFKLTCYGGTCSGSNNVSPPLSKKWWGGTTTGTASGTPSLEEKPTLGFGANHSLQCTYSTNKTGVKFNAANTYYKDKGCSIPPVENNKTPCAQDQFYCALASEEKNIK